MEDGCRELRMGWKNGEKNRKQGGKKEMKERRTDGK